MTYILIDRPKNISPDTILEIIEIYFRGKYKVVSQTDTRLVIKKLYKYKSNGWETIQKQLNSNDLACFEVFENTIKFEIIVWKQLAVLFVFLLFGFIYTWMIWGLSFVVALLIPSIPILIICAVKHYEIRQFINREKTEISKRIND